MLTEIIKKIIVFLTIMIGITLLSFCLSYLSPGDPAEMYYYSNDITPTQQMLDAKREELGLNRSFFVQYFDWLTGIVKGDFGTSTSSSTPVVYELAKALPSTIWLTLLSMTMTIIISVPLSLFCALHKGGKVDYSIQLITYLFSSLPSFFLSLILMYFLCMRLRLFPVIGTSGSVGIVMPAVVLSFANIAWFTRQFRAIALRELENEYVIGARARGLRERDILFKHVLKNSLMPLVTLLGISFGAMLGGSVIVESIFTWPGVGRMAVTAILNRDYPIIQGYVIWMACIFLIVNFVVDMSCKWINPKARKAAAAYENE